MPGQTIYRNGANTCSHMSVAAAAFMYMYVKACEEMEYFLGGFQPAAHNSASMGKVNSFGGIQWEKGTNK